MKLINKNNDEVSCINCGKRYAKTQVTEMIGGYVCDDCKNRAGSFLPSSIKYLTKDSLKEYIEGFEMFYQSRIEYLNSINNLYYIKPFLVDLENNVFFMISSSDYKGLSLYKKFIKNRIDCHSWKITNYIYSFEEILDISISCLNKTIYKSGSFSTFSFDRFSIGNIKLPEIENKSEKLVLTINLDTNKYHAPNNVAEILYNFLPEDLLACEEFCKLVQRYTLQKYINKSKDSTKINNTSIDVKLNKLCDLYKAGYLTDYEFKEAKQKVLNE